MEGLILVVVLGATILGGGMLAQRDPRAGTAHPARSRVPR